jgi:outer membrane protein TolC
MAYWAARGAQATRDLLRDTVDTFRQTVQYHEAQLSVGTIAEQDVMRVRLERERLQITADLAAVRASRAEATLRQLIGQPALPELVLTEPLDRPATPVAVTDEMIGQRPDVKAAEAAVAEARARADLQNVLVRPDLSVTYGYKRTQLPGTLAGSNTSIFAVTARVPLFDRNAGNRAAAAAETRRQEQLLAATKQSAEGDVRAAAQEFDIRRAGVAATLTPLREHATTLAAISQAAYAQGGGDLLRLLDTQRARLDAELAWVQGMVEFQQSLVNLEAAEGILR